MDKLDNVPQLGHLKPQHLPQSEQSKLEDLPQLKLLDDTQADNKVGGYLYKLDDFSLLRRLIILGSNENYYSTVEKCVTLESADIVLKLLAAGEGQRVVAEVTQISKEGRAPRQTPGIFVLAICTRLGDAPTRSAALSVLPVVCRTAFTLFEFVQYCKELGPVTLATRTGANAAEPAAVLAWIEQARLDTAAAEAKAAVKATATAAGTAAAADTATPETTLPSNAHELRAQAAAPQPATRGPLEGKPSWGRSFRRAICHWYLNKGPVAVAYQVTKYSHRHGWRHCDLLRLAHPDPEDFTAKKREMAAAKAAEATATVTDGSVDGSENAVTAAAAEAPRRGSEVAVLLPCAQGGADEAVGGDEGSEQDVLAAAVAAAAANAASVRDGLMSATEAAEAAFVADIKAIFEFVAHGTVPGQERKQRCGEPKAPPAEEVEPVAASEVPDTLSAGAAVFAIVAVNTSEGKKASATDASAAGATTVDGLETTTDVGTGPSAEMAPTSASSPPGPDAVPAVPLSPVMQYILDAHRLRKLIRAPPPLAKMPKHFKAWPVSGPRRKMPPAQSAPRGPTEEEFAAHKAATAAAIEAAVSLIRRHHFGHEYVGDTALLREPEIWSTFLEVGMPLTTMIRNLGRMTQIGVMQRPNCVRAISNRLRDPAALAAARVHPISMLEAMCTYSSGGGARGVTRWQVVPDIYGALVDAFYMAFRNVGPTGQRFLIGMDVSGSMTGPCSAMTSVPKRVAAAAMAIALVRSEPWAKTLAFSRTLVPLDISPDDKLEDVLGRTWNIPCGATDCALPMIFATEWGLAVDVFLILTDHDTWYGNLHPVEALRRYREVMGKPHAKLVVLALSSAGFSIADPEDPGMLDVAGMDSAVPRLVADFAIGKLL